MKNEAYVKVLGDLKVLMKRKMLEDKQHKSQHEDMKKEDDYEEEETEETEETDTMKKEDKKDNYVSDYMKSKSNRKKPRASALMISMSVPEKPKKSSGNSNKKKAY